MDAYPRPSSSRALATTAAPPPQPAEEPRYLLRSEHPQVAVTWSTAMISDRRGLPLSCRREPVPMCSAAPHTTGMGLAERWRPPDTHRRLTPAATHRRPRRATRRLLAGPSQTRSSCGNGSRPGRWSSHSRRVALGALLVGAGAARSGNMQPAAHSCSPARRRPGCSPPGLACIRLPPSTCPCRRTTTQSLGSSPTA